MTKSTLTALEFLQRAKAKISNKENWIKGNYARDANGYKSFYDSSNAVCFCSMGALYSIGENCLERITADIALDMASLKMNPRFDNVQNVMEFNDHPLTTHEQVMKMFDLAIEEVTPKSD